MSSILNVVHFHGAPQPRSFDASNFDRKGQAYPLKDVCDSVFSDQIFEESPLYRAQAIAQEVVKSTIFPCYRQEYVDSLTGLYGKAVWCYSKAYNAAGYASDALHAWISEIQSYIFHILLQSHFGAVYKAFKPLTSKIQPWIDTVYAYNPINGHRQLNLIPRSWEKFLGENVFFPMATGNMTETSELLQSESDIPKKYRESIAQRVKNVRDRLLSNNEELLNPKSETPFGYKVHTYNSPQLNAFACPGSNIAVLSQLIKEIDGALQGSEIEETRIEFADGSTATVDLVGVKRDDVIAALLGHEMTHIASRHSIVSMVASAIRSALLFAARMLSISYLKSHDPEYQDLVSRRLRSQLSANELATLNGKEQYYSRINDILGWIESWLKEFSGLFESRAHEYEADVTGVYMADQAGYSALGALYLQELFKRKEPVFTKFLHEHAEWMLSHPNANHRLASIFAAINVINKQELEDRVDWNVVKAEDSPYDMRYSSQAVRYATENSQQHETIFY